MMTEIDTILCGDALEVLRSLPDGIAHCCVTSPPYFGLRSYMAEGDPRKPFEIGLEATIEEYVAKMVEIFREVKRVLRPDGTLWLNLGDAYANDGKWGGVTSGKHAQGLHSEASAVGRADCASRMQDTSLSRVVVLAGEDQRVAGGRLQHNPADRLHCDAPPGMLDPLSHRSRPER